MDIRRFFQKTPPSSSRAKRPLSWHVTLVFATVVVSQIGVLSGAFYLFLQSGRDKEQKQLEEWASEIDSITYQDLVLQTDTNNDSAREMLIYSTILRNGLSFATVLKPNQRESFISKEIWLQTCRKTDSGDAEWCLKEANPPTIVGIIPLKHGDRLVGYFVKEAKRQSIRAHSPSAFLPFLLPILLVVFGFNIGWLLLYYQSTLRKELKKVLGFLHAVENQTGQIELPEFSTREFALISKGIQEAVTKVRQSENERQSMVSEAEKARIARQVAHDIRSPVSALSMVTNDLKDVSEDKRNVIRGSVKRILDISNQLLHQYSGKTHSAEPRKTQLLYPLVEEVIFEKRASIGSSRIRFDLEVVPPKGLFASVPSGLFKRVISNLVDNSIEAIPHDGVISVTVRMQREFVVVEVKDDGVGIPMHVLPLLMKEGVTHGKPKGNGIGLAMSKQAVESWGGDLKLQSKGRGCTVTLRIPEMPAPSCEIEAIEFKRGSVVIVVDDDPSIHAVWQMRLKKLEGDGLIRRVDCYNPESFREAAMKFRDSELICLVDYDLKRENATGLDLVDSLGLQRESILVTGRAEDPQIVNHCHLNDIRILPKLSLPRLPLSISSC